MSTGMIPASYDGVNRIHLLSPLAVYHCTENIPSIRYASKMLRENWGLIFTARFRALLGMPFKSGGLLSPVVSYFPQLLRSYWRHYALVEVDNRFLSAIFVARKQSGNNVDTGRSTDVMFVAFPFPPSRPHSKGLYSHGRTAV